MQNDKDKNKGRKGERNFLEKVIFKMQRNGEDIDYRKPTYTNEPDDGLDFELKVPHNTGERLEAIANHKDTIQPPSNKKIDIRVDHKNYDNKIGKPVAQKFIDDIHKNPIDTEHWLTGGNGLTKPAQEVLNQAQKPVRYFSQRDINTISNYYDNELENTLDNEK
ncbi:hypothetical protein [Anaerosporobacter sp.]|uniref:hypothetical protein n=1 Tax=Anaerosporobacter sp. TaxID=1872529 RepID=UPI00286F5F3B|nr:hypothetical protein [Anaerosporobacter sp.]